MKVLKLISAATLLVGTTINAADPTGEPNYQHPVIEDHGGIVVLPDAAHQPQHNSKIVLDITSDSKSGSVIKGFDRAALILNQYTQVHAGIENGFMAQPRKPPFLTKPMPDTRIRTCKISAKR